MDSRYITLDQLEPYVTNMVFFGEFDAKYGHSTDFTEELAQEWADSIDWENAAAGMFGETRQAIFTQARLEIEAQEETAGREFAETQDSILKSAQIQFEESSAPIMERFKHLTMDGTAESPKEFEERVTEWVNTHKAEIVEQNTLLAPCNAARDEKISEVNRNSRGYAAAAQSRYNRALAAVFARLYINS